MRVGLLGAGRIGELHLETLAHNKAVSEIRLFDIDDGRARELALAYDIAHSPDIESTMAWADAVVIATSTDSHTELLICAAQSQTAAFCEKPIAIDLGETDRAIAAIELSGIPVQMGFNRRFDPGFRAARDRVAAGSLGTLLTVVGHHHDHAPPPMHYIPLSGGQFKDQLIHDFDLLRFVTGDEAVRVHAAASSVALPGFAEHGDSTVAIVTLWMRSGALAVLVGARTDPVGYDVRMELFGTDDSLAVGLNSRTPLHPLDGGCPSSETPYREWLDRFGDSFHDEIEVFLAVAAGEKESPCTPADARAALVLAESAAISLEEERIVNVEHPR